LRFAGQYFDNETSTHYNINRDYDPKMGRYLQSDPIGFDGGVNSYGYVGANPMGAVDELGLATIKIGGRKITVHKSDVDPRPSTPHGHDYTNNEVIDKNGNIYKNGKIIGKFPKKQLSQWLEFLKNLKSVPVFFILKPYQMEEYINCGKNGCNA